MAQAAAGGEVNESVVPVALVVTVGTVEVYRPTLLAPRLRMLSITPLNVSKALFGRSTTVLQSSAGAITASTWWPRRLLCEDFMSC
jgi:hypothetical protein